MTAPHILSLLTALAMLGFGVAVCAWFCAYRFPVAGLMFRRMIGYTFAALLIFFVFGVVTEIGERVQTMMARK